MSLAHAILASLENHPNRCGYDLMKAFNCSVGQFWNASHQQIYRELAKMERRGWLSSKSQPQVGKPDKKLYHITPAGHEALSQWLTEPLKPEAVRKTLLIKLYAGHLLEPQVLLQELEREHLRLSEKQALFQAIQREYFAEPKTLDYQGQLLWLTLRAGLQSVQAQLDWLSEACSLIETEAARRASAQNPENALNLPQISGAKEIEMNQQRIEIE